MTCDMTCDLCLLTYDLWFGAIFWCKSEAILGMTNNKISRFCSCIIFLEKYNQEETDLCDLVIF